MSPQAWPVVATNHVEACPLPSRCQKFDPGLMLSHLKWLEIVWASVRPALPPKTESAPSGSDETKLVPSGSDETEPAPSGSGKVEPVPLGSKEVGPPRGVGRDSNYALNHLGELMFVAISFLPPFGFP
jgi:hypothetical protein